MQKSPINFQSSIANLAKWLKLKVLFVKLKWSNSVSLNHLTIITEQHRERTTTNRGRYSNDLVYIEPQDPIEYAQMAAAKAIVNCFGETIVASDARATGVTFPPIPFNARAI